MLYLKEKPTGVDIPIQNLQKRLYDKLQAVWGITGDKYNAFDRVYRNQTENGYIPEAYMGNGQYNETFIDDRYPVTSFFFVSDTVRMQNGAMQANISVIFCVNLSALKSTAKHRADEEVRLDVLELCRNYIGEVNAVITGIDNVFREFNATSVKFRDMHPFHCFRVNMTAVYKKC